MRKAGVGCACCSLHCQKEGGLDLWRQNQSVQGSEKCVDVSLAKSETKQTKKPNHLTTAYLLFISYFETCQNVLA